MVEFPGKAATYTPVAEPPHNELTRNYFPGIAWYDSQMAGSPHSREYMSAWVEGEPLEDYDPDGKRFNMLMGPPAASGVLGDQVVVVYEGFDPAARIEFIEDPEEMWVSWH